MASGISIHTPLIARAAVSPRHCSASASVRDRAQRSLPASRASRQSGHPQKIGILGHVLILLRVIGARLLPRFQRRRRPRLRPFAWQFRRDLHSVGLGVVRVPEEALAPLRSIVLDVESLGSGSVGVSKASFVKTAAGGLNGAFPATMSWHWSSNNDALELFRPAADAVRLQLGSDFYLIGASFVIASGGCRDGEAKFHLDFGPPAIPTLEAATALMPLYPLAFPEGQGNLEYLPWDADGAIAVHRYRSGQASVFDGKLAHRTQSFVAAAFVPGADSTAQPAVCSRVLASLSLARLPPGCPPPAWQDALAQVISGYGAPVMPPLGRSRSEPTD